MNDQQMVVRVTGLICGCIAVIAICVAAWSMYSIRDGYTYRSTGTTDVTFGCKK